MKNLIIVLVVVAAVVGGYFVFRPHTAVAPTPTPRITSTPMSSSTPTPVPSASRTPTPTPVLSVRVGAIHTVSIAGFAFNPATTTVTKGDIVVFTNNDSVQHTVTSDTSAFTGGTIAPGMQLTLMTANLAPGTYAFHCSIHPSMHGTIIVR